MSINEVAALAAVVLSIGTNVALYIHLSATMNTRFDSLVATMDGRFNSVDARFNSVDARFNSVGTRFDSVDARFEGIERRLELIQGDLHQMDIRLSKMEG